MKTNRNALPPPNHNCSAPTALRITLDIEDYECAMEAARDITALMQALSQTSASSDATVRQLIDLARRRASDTLSSLYTP